MDVGEKMLKKISNFEWTKIAARAMRGKRVAWKRWICPSPFDPGGNLLICPTM